MHLMLVTLALLMPSAAPHFDWDVPRLIDYADTAGRVNVAGLNVSVIAARSQDSCESLIGHYLNRFVKAGFHVVTEGPKVPGLKLPHIQALDPKGLWSYLVYVFPEPDGTTTLMLGATHLGPHLRRPTPPDPELPVMPSASGVVVARDERSLSVGYQVKASPQDVQAYYRAVMSAAGFEEEPGLRFITATEAIELHVSTRGQWTSVSVVRAQRSD